MANSAFLQRYLMPWTVVAVNTVGVTNNGYVTNAAGTTTVDLPASSAVGDVFSCATIQGNFQVDVGVGQTVYLSGGVSSAGGSITSNAVGDSVHLVCVVANTDWVETASSGILTVV